MLLTMQALVRRRFHPLVMTMIAGGFLLLLSELVLYAHFQSLQLVGAGAVVIGLIAALLGIRARGRLCNTLVVIFLVVSLAGVLGLWFHNLERLGVEVGGVPPQAEGQLEGGPGDGPGEGKLRMPPPVLASLSVTGLCMFGAVMLLARRDDDQPK